MRGNLIHVATHLAPSLNQTTFLVPTSVFFFSQRHSTAGFNYCVSFIIPLMDASFKNQTGPINQGHDHLNLRYFFLVFFYIAEK